MAYRNKTFISFASEDINYYRMMEAWRDNDKMDFNFHDAHDLNVAFDTSQPDTIRRRLRERLANTKQVVMLISDVTRSKAADHGSFIHYEVTVIEKLKLPVVFANLNKRRESQSNKIPQLLTAPYTISVPFGLEILKYALDNFPEDHEKNQRSKEPKSGAYYYPDSAYEGLGALHY